MDRAMFPKETPPPNQYTRKKHYPVLKEEPESRTQKIVKWGFVIIGALFIIGIFVFSPRQKHMVCTGAAPGQNSLTTFGTCTEE